MKIETSRVDATATHVQLRHSEIRSETQFSFAGLVQAADAQIAAGESTVRSTDSPAALRRIRLLLEDLVAAMLALLSGEKCRSDAEGIAGLREMPAVESSQARPAGASASALAWETQTVERVEEHERTNYAAEGCVRTADGREIGFQVGLAMCRDSVRTTVRNSSGQVAFRDPLVINFDGNASELDGRRFTFDLDADGAAESLPGLAAGSAFVVFDRNGDGRINDGRELFGATGEFAGDGFAELAALDGDGNGWLDAGDPAFAALGVWFPGGEIKPLASVGVGALHTQGSATPFELKDGGGETQGRVWESGVWLAEDGRAGTLQQIDLAASR